MMQESSARNPMSYPNQSGGTMYDKLKSLAEEITEGIFNLSGSHVKRMDIQSDLDSIAGIASREKSPEVVVNILLFRKYADIANQLKDNKENSPLNLIGELPSFVYENNDVELVGWTALGSKIFWFRLIVAILAFMSFVIMSTVPNISYADFKPANTFHSGCQYRYMIGSFNYRPYQVVIALAVLVYLYNALFAIYYILPTDVNKRKFVPGLVRLLTNCMSPDLAEAMSLRASICCHTFSTFTEMLLDAILLVMSAITCVAGSIIVERSARFTYTYNGVYELMYFSIGSFFATFTRTNPMCMDEYHDPGPKIRASLAMLYIALFFLTLCLFVSATAFRKELKNGAHRGLILSAGLKPTTSSSRGNSHGGGGDGEEVVEFRALPTSVDDDEMSRSSHNDDRSMSV